MGYDSLRIELRYRHIWQTKWAAAAGNPEDGGSVAGGAANVAAGGVSGGNTASNLSAPGVHILQKKFKNAHSCVRILPQSKLPPPFRISGTE